jgi:hypothetical protein
MTSVKLTFTVEEVERWRDRVHRRTPQLAIQTKREALAFIESTGFCLAFGSDGSHIPSLWQAVCGVRTGELSARNHADLRHLSAWHVRGLIPAGGKVFYGRLLRHRPTIVSLEFLPYFIAAVRRTAMRNAHTTDYRNGRLSSGEKVIVDALTRESPQNLRSLKESFSRSRRAAGAALDRVLGSLEAKLYITRIKREDDSGNFEWGTIGRLFPAQVRLSRTIPVAHARARILERFFQNQLVATVEDVRRVFGWPRQAAFEALGRLMEEGRIAARARVEGTEIPYYCFVR